MLSKIFLTGLLVAVSVAIHAAGVTAALAWLPRWSRARHAPLGWTWLFTRVAGWMILLHVCEIATWGLYYHWTGAIPGWQTAFYFSGVTYTTTGYGDIVLPPPWRLVGAVEALTGILMCGWSTGFFFAIVSRVQAARAPGVGERW